MSSSLHIAEALIEALESSNPSTLVKLHQAMEAYKTKYPRTWSDLQRQPFARKLLSAMSIGVSPQPGE